MRRIIESKFRRGVAGGLCGAIAVALLTLGLFTTPGVVAPSVQAQLASGFKCSNGTLSGRYALRGDGWVPPGPAAAPTLPFAVVSLMTLDGAGTLSNDVTVSTNGGISRNVDPGTYTVNEDCKGNMSINIAVPPFVLNFDLVVADGGKEFELIATTPSVVTIGAKRLH